MLLRIPGAIITLADRPHSSAGYRRMAHPAVRPPLRFAMATRAPGGTNPIPLLHETPLRNRGPVTFLVQPLGFRLIELRAAVEDWALSSGTMRFDLSFLNSGDYSWSPKLRILLIAIGPMSQLITSSCLSTWKVVAEMAFKRCMSLKSYR
jgi:hypothetical protein